MFNLVNFFKKLFAPRASMFTDIDGKQVTVKRPVFLVGTDNFSSDEGVFPNADSFPVLVTRDIEEADGKYEALKKSDHKWTFGYRYAYIVVAEEGESVFHTIRGVQNWNRS